MKVGIFDSGVGGITVLKEAMKQLPHIEYIYYADNLHVPYGTKPKEEVLGYVIEVVDFLIREGAKVIVIACNTATCIAVQKLRELYSIPIIGMEPAVKLALEDNTHGRILVTATSLALQSEKYHQLIEKVDMEGRAVSLPLPELVTFAEHQEVASKEVLAYFKAQLAPYALEEFTGMVLGCTHFVYFKKCLQELLPAHIKLYDGNAGTVRHLKDCLGIDEVPAGARVPNVTFYYSGKRCRDLEILESYLKLV